MNQSATPAVTFGGDSDSIFIPKTHWKKLFAVRKFLSLANSQSSQAPAKELIFNKFRVGKKIANGSFGQIRLGLWTQNKENVAIKLEHQEAKIPMLFFEYRFYEKLMNEIGFPKIYHYGSFGKYNALVMELLGPNLEELFSACNRSFSLSTVLQIGIQLVTRMEVIHSHGIIYRDVKPENFLVGHSSHNKNNLIHVVDFGLAKEYIDPQTGRHISYAKNKLLTGTVRYMSINAHQGKEQSRRDDMEALSHVFFYFLTKGNLPWQGTSCEDIVKKYQTIGFIKEETSTVKFGQEFPWEFTVFLRYCRSLKFTQSPNYNYLRNLFRNCLKRLELQEDYVFDWMLPLETGSSNVQQTLALQTENLRIGMHLNNTISRESYNLVNNDTKMSVHSMTYSKSRSLPSSINVYMHSVSSKKSRKMSDGIQKRMKNMFLSKNHETPKATHQNIPNIQIEHCSSNVLPTQESNDSRKEEYEPLDTLKVTSKSSVSSGVEEGANHTENPNDKGVQFSSSSSISSKRGGGGQTSFINKYRKRSSKTVDFPLSNKGIRQNWNSEFDDESNLEKQVSFFTCCPMISLW